MTGLKGGTLILVLAMVCENEFEFEAFVKIGSLNSRQRAMSKR